MPTHPSPQHLVLTACRFERPVRIPRFESFWEYPDEWRQRLGPSAEMTDVEIWVPDETTFPTHARRLREEGGWVYSVDGWGRTIRTRPDAYFSETLAVPIPDGTDPDSVEFDSPLLDERYLRGEPDEASLQTRLGEARTRHCIFGKTGGPFLRTSFVRGEEQFLMDIAQDPPLARALADKVSDHLTAVGVQEIARWRLQGTGIWIYDDMAYNDGPMFSPASFERVFLPAYRRMIRRYKDAGARHVFLHSDGNIMPILDMLVDAGIDGLHPLERRAGMDMFAVRRRHPRLVLVGGMDNTDTLINGPIARVEAEARQIIDLGRDGGVIIGSHSISPEIPLEHYVAYDRVCRTYGVFS